MVPGVPHRGSGYPAATLSRAATGKGGGRCHLPGGLDPSQSAPGNMDAARTLPARARRGSPAVPFPSAFPLTERNDQTEQEERREIKQRLTRKVLCGPSASFPDS